MVSVRVNSGPPDPTSPLRYIAEDRWGELVSLRRDFLIVNLGYDCRNLVQFVREAEQMWQVLGYESADDLIRRGYDLEPEEIRLAVRWLELNPPPHAVGLEEAKTRAQRMAADEGVKAIGNHGGKREGGQ